MDWNSRIAISKKFKELVDRYGKDNVLETWDYCSDYGCMLEGSTIDQVRVINDEIVFVYNENVPYDSDYLNTFTLRGVQDFYEDLVKAIEDDNAIWQ